MALKTLDRKLAAIRADPSASRDFILADAKDIDMATGVAAARVDPIAGKRRTAAEYRQQIRGGAARSDIDNGSANTVTAEMPRPSVATPDRVMGTPL